MAANAPRRFIPDDSAFERSVQLMENDEGDYAALRLAALSQLPTPVAAEQCFRMWISAPTVADSHNIDEILQSLAGNQPQAWKEARVEVRDFVRIPKHGISFVCTSQAVCHQIGGLTLTICGVKATIRKYSLYDKWYYVDLTRLPNGVDDTDIYRWFSEQGVRPVLIAPKHRASGLISRDRTVFFAQVGCPDALFVNDKEALREIFFDDSDKPCFVHHRNRALNRTKPPSLKKAPKPKRHIELSDTIGDDTIDMDTTDGDDQGNDTTPPPQPVTAPPRTIIIPKVDPKTLNDWQLIARSKHGLVDPNATRSAPEHFTPCELRDNPQDPFSLTYDLAVTANMYDVLSYDYMDEATSPDIDIEASRDGVQLNGFTADSPLLPLSSAGILTRVRFHQHKVEHMTVDELAKAIDEYMVTEFQSLASNHDDVLAAIKAQPAYHRRLFQLEDAAQTTLIQQHAVYRALMTEPIDGDSTFSFTHRLRSRFGDNPPDIDTIFRGLFKEQQDQDNAYNYALTDLLLMVMAPSIYVDPIKVQILIPSSFAPCRLRYSAFLVWSDITLSFIAQTDVCATLLQHNKIPQHVKAALTSVKAGLPASADQVMTTRTCHPRL